MILKKFRTLNLAKEFFKDCNALQAKPPIGDQLRRAALSIVNNLSEGTSKPSIKERARYYNTSLCSYRECEGMLDILNEKELLEKYDYLGICLFNLYRYTLNPRKKP